MKVNIDSNGWTVEIKDIDLNTATDQEINTMACLANYFILVIIRNQNLSVVKQEEICKRIGRTLDEDFDPFLLKKLQGRLAHSEGSAAIRVTGEKNANGEPGLFGFKEELRWHADKVERANRKSLIWLYSEKGSIGSTTEFTNHVLAYKSLDTRLKDKIKNLKSVYLDTANYSKDERETLAKFPLLRHEPNLIHTNESGQTGIFLSWLHLDYFVGMSKEKSKNLVLQIQDHILGNPSHIYRHEWNNGDVILNDQWLGVHRRLPFEDIEKRVLCRIETDYSRTDFTALPEILESIQ